MSKFRPDEVLSHLVIDASGAVFVNAGDGEKAKLIADALNATPTEVEPVGYGPTCPFCGRDPFVYVDNGVGMEAVAVDCCELGDQYFRGMRPIPDHVKLSWEEFQDIGNTLSQLRYEIELSGCALAQRAASGGGGDDE